MLRTMTRNPARIFHWLATSVAILALVAVFAEVEPVNAQDTSVRASIIQVALDGPVGPASADHIIRAIDQAAESNSQLLIIQLNTPGGLDAAMRDMVSAILASPVPVATWVAPSGARAASAGTYILMASHVAAMSNATNVGSSTPVSAGGSGEDLDDKIINDAAAYLEGLAELRGRNVDWARQTVTDAANISATEALQLGVINLVADDQQQLLAQLDGRNIETEAGQITLNTQDAAVETIHTNWRYDFLSIITNPNIAYILLMVGVYGLILEFYNPGGGIAGTIGIISLLVGAYALQLLPISYAGLALIVIGIAMMAFEVITPTFGVAGVGGVIAFALGSVMLMDTNDPAWQISLSLVAAITVSTGALVVFVLGAALKARNAKVTTGVEAMTGALAIAREDFETRGHVQLHGEIWQAVSRTPVRKGDQLQIDHVDGLTLHVSAAQAAPNDTHSNQH
ncbi:nodulation protein NfeD [Pseudohongiella sp. SYSU M77423]|uniref:NfeD family protein n=1 Tax=Pseudohongiella sp. SYSU M77423 TaxID=3042312 RepID=UPI00248011B6|nr:nodulation protein NfeD [Pseudohongiella sp. SYSU M77423]MDH7942488.1 nodulation protein NfeD [Pseudohongiella sp. SYSU M77423]|tara:strand:+ start:949 stop:2316 length:1368 start_codon:yes stop_codon:yes gene_type:complete